MEGDRRGAALKTRSGTQFKKKGVHKKARWGQEHHENTQIPDPTDTVYRILCPSRKIGSVIGKGGSIINALREETQSKITVANLIPGSEERVIMIYSAPEKKSMEDSDEAKEESMRPHCPAQYALMRVNDRIIEEDLLGGKEDDEDNNGVLTVRLLVPDNMVGCVLGKGGDVIQRLRSQTGASIRVLPGEHVPTCALCTDELVQIQGKPAVLKKALYEISTLLHQNPRKDKALNFSMPFRGPSFRPSIPPSMPLSRSPMWSPRSPPLHMPPPPWMEDYDRHPGLMAGGFDDDLTRPGVESSGEFSMKILCLTNKIGGVIGKGGINVRQLQQETGTSIHVEDASAESEERVIRVSAFETLRNPRSQTIDAILVLQNKTSEVSEKGVITTRLLVPSKKVGCLLGQGGKIINEMRRRTQAEIRVLSNDEKPECASEDEELVQISGSFGVSKDALGEIGLRLRARCLRDSNVEAELTPPRRVQAYGGLSRGRPTINGPGGYNTVEGGVHDYEPPSYSPVQPSASRYPVPNEVHYPNSAGSSLYANTAESPGTRMTLHDPYHGGSDYFNGAPQPGIHHNPHQGSYPNPSGQGAYPTTTPPQPPYQSPYPNPNQIPYGAQHSAYHSVPAHGAYQY